MYVSEEKARELERSLCYANDIIFTKKGTLGQTGLVPDDNRFEKYLLSSNQMKLSVDPSLADALYVYYFVSSVASREKIRRDSEATGVPKTNLAYLRTFPIPLPTLEEQEAISAILGAFDDKIELNRQMNATLEEMARAIFKSWFVDFDPVRAKARGEEPYGTDAETAALFPDGFEVVDGREVPAEWQVTELGEVVNAIETGSRPKGGIKGITEGVPSVGAESIVGLGQFDFSKTKYVSHDFFNNLRRGKVNDRDILLYKDGGRPGLFEPHVTIFGDGFPFQEFCINSHVYRIRSNPIFCQEYLYFWLDSDWAMMEMKNRATGVAIPGINSTALRQIPIIVPKLEIVWHFAKIVGPILKLVFNNCNEARTLALLRDTLLPRFMSGHLRVI